MIRVGILGGGQLGRMLALAGLPLGMRFRFLDPAPNCPAAAVGEHVQAEFDDIAALDRFADGLDLVTYEFENVSVGTARYLAERLPLHPHPQALEVGQDRLDEKSFLRSLGLPTADYLPVGSADALRAAIEDIGLPAVVKTRRHGYDGRGQAVLRAGSDVDAAWSAIGEVPAILEAFVPFRRELSIVVARASDGSLAPYPLVENVHRHGILWTTCAPAANVDAARQRRAEEYARTLLERLEYVGVLAIELFETGSGELLVNEIAPRVHNSGHWSIEGAVASQFENHLRAVAGLPLGSTESRGFAAMVNLIGVVPDPRRLLEVRGSHLHLYGKEPRPGRKLGHVTVVAASEDERTSQLRKLSDVVDGH